MMDRRQFLQWTGTLGMGLFISPKTAFSELAAATDDQLPPDLELALRAAPHRVRIFPHRETDVWAYTGRVLKGDPAQLTPIPGSYLGPVIRAKKGQRVRIRFENALPASSIVHWHGLDVPADMDGHPRLAVPPGENYLYDFTVLDRAGTYWYHPHPHGTTGHQVYGGLAGLFLVDDDEEARLGLPEGEYDLPLVIQDRRFDREGQLVYMTGNRMEWLEGFLGDTVLVNGRPDLALDVAARPYRLRILNGSNSRIYNLAWTDGSPLTVLGSDGGLLQAPETKQSLLLAPGERVDLWADFTGVDIGKTRRLVSRRFDAGVAGGMHHGGMMGRRRMRGRSAPPNGYPLEIAAFHVDRPSSGPIPRLPERLSEPDYPTRDQAGNAGRPKRFRLDMHHMGGTINGRVFDMIDVAKEETVGAGSLEVWEFFNGGHMMAMPHPMHLHGSRFRVLERRGAWSDGYLDSGWKDTVLIMPGEQVRLLVRFGSFSGLYLYHCHNLEHEDLGMMRNLYLASNSKTSSTA